MWTVKENGKLVTENEKDWDELEGNLSELSLVFPEGKASFSSRMKGFFQFKSATIDVFPTVGKSKVVSQTIGRVIADNGDCELKTFDFKTRKFLTQKEDSNLKLIDSDGVTHRNEITRRKSNINSMKLNKDTIK